jgi:YbbR domain-containing protein
MIPTLRNFIFQDMWLKLFSLALAVLIWFTVNFATKNDVPGASLSPLTPKDERTFHNVPVVLMCSAEEVRAFKVYPKEVEVTVEGESKILQKLDGKELRAVANLTGIGAAENLHMKVEVSTPPGVSRVRVEPQEVQITCPPKNLSQNQ